MTFQDRLEIFTSEGVTVRLTIAGIGSRSLAWLLDGLLIGLALFMIGVVGLSTIETDSLLGLGLISIVALFLPLAYLTAFDVLNGGRTPGKMAAGIKTVRTSGAPVGFGSAVVRALFVPVDFFVFGVGIITMFANDRSQRIGDIAARTVVVRDRERQAAAPPVPEVRLPEGPRWDVSTIGDEELAVIRSFLTRAPSLPPERRSSLARDLRRRVEPQVGGVDRAYADEAFLQRILIEKLAPDEGQGG